MKQLLAVAVILLLPIVSIAEDKGIANTPIEKEVAGFKVGKDHEMRIVSLYGEGLTYQLLPEEDDRFFDFSGRCYFFLEERTVLKLKINKERRISAIELTYSDDRECKAIKTSKLPLVTGRGLMLGMSLDDALEIYGLPDSMYVEKLNNSDLNLMSKKNLIPNGEVAEEFARDITKKRYIPKELSKREFLLAFGNPAKIIGIDKTVIYEWTADYQDDQSFTRHQKAYLHFFKGELVKIGIQEIR